MQGADTVDGGANTALLEALKLKGTLDAAQAERALRAHEREGTPLPQVLTHLGLVTEAEIAAALAEVLGIPLARPHDYPDQPLFAQAIAERFLREFRALPIREGYGGVHVAMADPTDGYVAKAIALRTGKEVHPCVAVPVELDAAMERLYGEAGASIASIVDELGQGEDTDADIERLRDLANDAPVVRLVDALIGKAVEAGASDIHIEPFESRLRVRFRIDGVLHEVDAPPLHFRAAIASRVKIMANLNIAERRLPQDGRVKLAVRGKAIDLRVSTVPAMYGESVVLRILDRASVVLDFGSLGFGGRSFDAFLDNVARPNGILLVTGPTGSGKTTTLYAALSRLNDAERKILTVEDPVEYQLEGVNQIQVKPQIGLTFANVLRSLLRQDPDVIMVGEVRDLETAQMAVQASLTGHLVLSTLHTNSAAASVTRLLDMGVEAFLLTSSVTGVLAQRLVRRLCPRCREAYDAREVFPAEHILVRNGPRGPVWIYRARGCSFCRDTGYAGRKVVFEFLPMSDSVRGLVMRRAEMNDIHRAAVQDGMATIYENGIAKVLRGDTSFEEVLRVTQEA